MIVGTAGHIDHGKTTSARAPTGVDAGRPIAARGDRAGTYALSCSSLPSSVLAFTHLDAKRRYNAGVIPSGRVTNSRLLPESGERRVDVPITASLFNRYATRGECQCLGSLVSLPDMIASLAGVASRETHKIHALSN